MRTCGEPNVENGVAPTNNSRPGWAPIALLLAACVHHTPPPAPPLPPPGDPEMIALLGVADARAAALSARVAALSGDRAVADDRWRWAVRYDPESAALHAGRARWLLASGRGDEAVDPALEAVRLAQLRALEALRERLLGGRGG